MDDSPVFTSEYLQNRVREKRAEGTRSNRQQGANSSQAQRRLTAGRDDDIFNNDDDTPHLRKVSGRVYQSSPGGPVAQRSSQSRRSSNLANGATSGPRAMGAREMEDHVDKLSKQNFDLKLEVYHRRERIEQLEKKLEDLPRLQEDNAELLEVNDELVQELEKRDKALDEAVVMICDLEEEHRVLKDELMEMRTYSSGQRPLTSGSAETTTPALSAHNRRTDGEGLEESDCQVAKDDVSAPLTGSTNNENAVPKRTRPRQVPSFIDSNHSMTNALRSMYMDGDKMIRPIPSQTSMASEVEGTEDQNATDDMPPSPRLSVLSESDFKSIYGREDASDAPGSIKREISHSDNAESRSPASSHSSQARLARTDQWVADRAMSPPRPQRSPPGVEQFQSLGDVLQKSPSKSHRDRTNGLRTSNESTPGLLYNPSFNQNTYPPTPDTMLTRPSNQSSTSISQDKSLLDGTPAPAKTYAPLLPSSATTVKHTGHPSNFKNRGEGEVGSKDIETPSDSTSDLDHNSNQPENISDASHSLYPRNESHQHLKAPRRRPPVPKTDHIVPASPPRSSPSPPRIFNSRRKSIEVDIDSPTLPRHDLARLHSDPKPALSITRTDSIENTPTKPTFSISPFPKPSFATPPSKSSSAPRVARTDPPINRRIHLQGPRPSTPPSARPAVAQPARETNNTNAGFVPRHTAALRARVTRLARRNSASTSSTTNTSSNSGGGKNLMIQNLPGKQQDRGATPSDASYYTAPSQVQTHDRHHSRSGSIGRKTRQLFQRRGSSTGRKTASQPASPVKGFFEGQDRESMMLARDVVPATEFGMIAERRNDAPSSWRRRGSHDVGGGGGGVMTSIPIVPLGRNTTPEGHAQAKVKDEGEGEKRRRRRDSRSNYSSASARSRDVLGGAVSR